MELMLPVLSRPLQVMMFLDGSLPFTATNNGKTGNPPISIQPTDVFTSVTTKTGQQTLNSGSVGYHGGVPTIATVTHTFSRPVDTTGSISSYPGISMGLNLPGSRAPASYCGFTLPASAIIVPQSTTSNLSVPALPLAVSSSSCSSVSVPAALPTSSVRHQFNQVTDYGPSLDGFKSILDDFRQSISSELTSFSNRLGTLENIANKSNSPVISLLPDHNIGSDLEDSDEEERFSVAPGSQEEGFTSDEEGNNPTQVSQNVSQPSVPVSISSSVIGHSSTNSSKDPEAEDTPSTLKDLRDSVYTIMRDVNKVVCSSAGGSSYNSQEKRRKKMTNDGGNKPKKSSFPKSKPNSFKRGDKRANPSS
ncbi:unnamed protein product [Mytilus coruscus]|uniref:Uncharacterized protein n=1 Tax=Mytilus coruscus TaxID=42192 RepID=A0A6J8BAV2_MYTCO|nr:unnamed protein product [Mytilus coruscus]